jgi:hypothetical protein
MPKSFTLDDLVLALAQEAFSEHDIIDLATDSAGASDGTTVKFGDLAHGATGITDTAFHDVYLYLRRFTGLATAGGASTITLRTSMGTLAADVLKNFTIKITDGTSSGDERTISANSNADPTVVTVSSAFSSTPDTTSYYEIYPSGSDVSSQIIRTAKALSTGSFAETTGAITVAPGFNGDAGTNMLMGIGSEMLFYRERPDLHIRAINRILRNMRYPAYLPVGMITDGDMEDTGVTNWAAVGSPTTREKSDTTDSGLPFGRQVLHIAAGDGVGATSNAVSVDENEILYVAVLIDLVAGSADVILYDDTGTTALKTVNVTELNPCMVLFQQSPESTTKNVTVRLLGSEASSEFYVGPVFLWSGQRTRYAADTSSLERGRDINNTVTLRPGQSIETDVYQIGELEDSTFSAERDDRANLLSIIIPRSAYPTLIQGDRRYVELPYDTSATFAERDMVVQGAMYHISMARAKKLRSSNPVLAGQYRADARDYARTYSQMLEGTGVSLVDVLDESSDRQLVRFR